MTKQMTKQMTKVFIVEKALTSGIIRECEAEVQKDGRRDVFYCKIKYKYFYEGKGFFFSLEEAQEHVEALRIKRIALLEKQIANLEAKKIRVVVDEEGIEDTKAVIEELRMKRVASMARKIEKKIDEEGISSL